MMHAIYVLLGVLATAWAADECATLPAYPTWTQNPFHMPRDLSQHARYSYETNWLLGHVQTAAGRVFGVELMMYTLLASAEHGCSQATTPGATTVAVADAQGGRFMQETVISASFNSSVTPFYFQPPESAASSVKYYGPGTDEDWATQFIEAKVSQAAGGGGSFAFQLRLNASGADEDGTSQPVQAQGDLGVIPTPGDKYGVAQLALPLITAEGTLVVDGEVHQVTGRFWNQHMWGTGAKDIKPFGWSWFCVLLDDAYMLQLTQNRFVNLASSRLNFITPTGANTMYTPGNWTVVGDRPWTSPRTNFTYATSHRIVVEREQLDITITTHVLDNELNPFPGAYFFEGVSHVNGTHKGKPVKGWGYTERRPAA